MWFIRLFVGCKAMDRATVYRVYGAYSFATAGGLLGGDLLLDNTYCKTKHLLSNKAYCMTKPTV